MTKPTEAEIQKMAEEKYPFQDSIYFTGPVEYSKHKDLIKTYRDCFKEGYLACQQSQPKVDVEELKKDFRSWRIGKFNSGSLPSTEETFEWFKTYLHPQQPAESEAVKVEDVIRFVNERHYKVEFTEQYLSDLVTEFKNRKK